VASVFADLDTEQTLLALKVAFLVLLYLFIWAVVRSVTRDLRSAPQESIVLSAKEANELRARYEPVVPTPVARLLVLESPTLAPGSTVEIREPTRLGRGGENAIRLDGDDFASTRHAMVEPRPDGLWVEDVGSTNGTFVNGARVTTARLLVTGDIIRIGKTDLQVET
jgi:FHA domain